MLLRRRTMAHFFCAMGLAGIVASAAPAGAEVPMSPVRDGPALDRRAKPAEQSPAASGGAAAPAGRELRPMRRPGSAPDHIKPGLWEFTAELQAAEPTPYQAGKPPPATPAAVAGGAKTSYTSCIAADDAIPAEFGAQCRLDRTERKGATVAWWMSCADTQVQAEGVAQYDGNTMQASMVSHLPAAGGAVADVRQRITGRYVGPCDTRASLAPPTRSDAAAPEASPPPASGAEPASPDVAASGPADSARTAAEDAKPADKAAAAAKTRDRREARRHSRQARSAHHRKHRARRSASRYYWSGRSAYYGAFGPNPYSSNGP